MKNIILAGFDGKNNPARTVTEKAELPCTKLILPNDKVRDSELLIEMLSETHFDYVLSFGQRPNIKDKVHIETNARDGDLRLDFAGRDAAKAGRLQPAAAAARRRQRYPGADADRPG